MGACSECGKKDRQLVPRSWHPDDPEKSMCASCFGYYDPKAKIEAFDTPRGGLLSRWAAEGFGDHIMVSSDGNKLLVLAPMLDEHHRQLIVQNDPDNVIPDGLLEDYRTSQAIYGVEVVQFWREMWGFY